MRRITCLLMVAFLVGWARLPSADGRGPEASQRADAHTVGLFNLSFDDSPEEPAAPVILTQGLEQLPGVDGAATTPLVATNVESVLNQTWLDESVWYTRIDYFQWQETFEGQRFMQNEGVAPTLGWQQRRGQERYRFDLFGARPEYYAPIDGHAVSNVTDYLGLRGEYELMWEPQKTPHYSYFAGIGSRYFVRSIPDVIVRNRLYYGYQESWWTFYPYVGFETRRTLKPGRELYGMTRVGMTAFTREHITHNDVTLFPRPGVTVQSEFGLRGPRLAFSWFTELMTWSMSPLVLNYEDNRLYHIRQPASLMLTIGGRVSWSY